MKKKKKVFFSLWILIRVTHVTNFRYFYLEGVGGLGDILCGLVIEAKA